MFDDGEDSVYDRLGEMVWDRVAVIFPLRIIRLPEGLTILDYRPTFVMAATVAGFVVLSVSFVLLFFGIDRGASLALVALGAPAAACGILVFRGTIREAYYFNKTDGSYAFVRQFIHRKDVIEGAMSQFTAAYVKTETNEDTNTYYVILKQEGMFLTGVSEQTLREVVPIFNSFEREASIANAISEVLSSK